MRQKASKAVKNTCEAAITKSLSIIFYTQHTVEAYEAEHQSNITLNFLSAFHKLLITTEAQSTDHNTDLLKVNVMFSLTL